jgi:hypothetical protein
MKSDPDETYPPVRCKVCGGPLAATDGDDILKYFLVRRSPNRRRGTRARQAATNTIADPPVCRRGQISNKLTLAAHVHRHGSYLMRLNFSAFG